MHLMGVVHVSAGLIRKLLYLKLLRIFPVVRVVRVEPLPRPPLCLLLSGMLPALERACIRACTRTCV